MQKSCLLASTRWNVDSGSIMCCELFMSTRCMASAAALRSAASRKDRSVFGAFLVAGPTLVVASGLKLVTSAACLRPTAGGVRVGVTPGYSSEVCFTILTDAAGRKPPPGYCIAAPLL